MTDSIQALIKSPIGKDMDKLVQFLFKDKYGEGIKLTDTQMEMVKDIVFNRVDQLIVAAYTGWGKTFTLAIAFLLSAVINQGEKIGHISISGKQTSLCYDYILDFISRQPLFTPLMPTRKRDLKSLRKEINKERITIGNSSISVLTANLNQKGRNLLGFHFDKVARDEDAEIPDDIYYERIGRMLEESQEDRARGVKKMDIGISTTHHRGHFKKQFDDPEIKTLVADDKIGLTEGRVTKEFLAKRKKALGDYKYGVWYQCRFPSQEGNKFFSEDDVRLLLRETSFNDYERAPIRVLAIDVARFGKDETVLTMTVKSGGQYFSKVLEHFNKQPTTHTVGVAIKLHNQFNFDYIVVDDSGVGGGVSDMLLERNVSAKVIKFIAGGKPINESSDEKFNNAASEVYDFVQKRTREGLCFYEENQWIRDELLQIEFEFDSRGRLVISKKGKFNEEDNSPDYADSLAYSFVPFIQDHSKGGYAFVSY